MTTYDGKVQPGGDAQTRDVGNARIHKRSVGSMNNNAYLIESDGQALLIDAAADWPKLQEMIQASGAQVVAIATTHRHHDHVGALAEAVAHSGAPTYAGADDADAIDVPTATLLHDGDTLTVGDLVVTATHLRGHTPVRSRCRSATPTEPITSSPATRSSPAASAPRITMTTSRSPS